METTLSQNSIDKIQQFLLDLTKNIEKITADMLMDMNGPEKIVCGPIGYNLLCKALDYRMGPTKFTFFAGRNLNFTTINLFGYNIPIETNITLPPNGILILFERGEKRVIDCKLEDKLFKILINL